MTIARFFPLTTERTVDPALLLEATITTTDDFACTDEDDGHGECDHTNGVYHCDAA